MDDSETCINCNNKFEKRNKGYKRTSIDSQNKLPAISLRSVLNNTIDTQVTPDKSLYVCNTCASSVVKIFKSQSTTKDALDEFNKLQADTSYIRKRKRPLFQSTPSKQTFEFVSPQSTADKSLLSPVSKKRCNIFSPKKVVSHQKKQVLIVQRVLWTRLFRPFEVPTTLVHLNAFMRRASQQDRDSQN